MGRSQLHITMGALFSFLAALDLNRPPEDDHSSEPGEIPGAYPSFPQPPPAPQAECKGRFAQESLNQAFKCTM